MLENGIVQVTSVFRKHFPNVKYQSSKATKWIMQLPVVVFTICQTSEQSSSQKLYVVQQKKGVNYAEMIYFSRS